MDLSGEDMDVLTKKYIVQRDGTLRFLNERNMIRIFKNILVYKTEDEQKYPCFVWKDETEPRMVLERKRYALNRFLYDYCVGELSAETRIVQICDKTRVCVQPFHYRKWSREKASIRTEKRRSPRETSFPDPSSVIKSQEEGKAMVDSEGNIFMTREMFERLIGKDPTIIDPLSIDPEEDGENIIVES